MASSGPDRNPLLSRTGYGQSANFRLETIPMRSRRNHFPGRLVILSIVGAEFLASAGLSSLPSSSAPSHVDKRTDEQTYAADEGLRGVDAAEQNYRGEDSEHGQQPTTRQGEHALDRRKAA